MHSEVSRVVLMKRIALSVSLTFCILLSSIGLTLIPIQSANAQYSGCPNTWSVQLPNLQVKTDQFGRSRFSFLGESYSSVSPRITFSKYVPSVERYVQSLKQNAVGVLKIQISDTQDFKRSYLGSEKLMGFYYAGVVPFWGPIFDDEDSGVFEKEPINPWLRLQVRIDVKNCEPAIFNSNGIQIVGDVYTETHISELNRLASGARMTYQNSLNSVGDFQVDLPKALALCETEIPVLDLKINDANARIAKLNSSINDPQTTESTKRTYRTSLVSWNTALKSYQERKSNIEKLKRFLEALPALVQETKTSSWNSQTNRNLYPVQKSPTPNAIIPTPSKKSQASIAGQTCAKPGQTRTIDKARFACLIVGKKYQWTALNPESSTKSAEPSAPSSSTSSNSTAADRLVLAGCKAFPSAIIRFQNSSGSTYNSALKAAQEASISITQAARLDGRYGVLSNAQFIIVQYAQAVGWGGRGYPGDINTVRTAVATFNSSCGSNLKLK